MADDSIDVTVPYENHQERNPPGMLGYDYGALNSDQQRALNDLKIRTIRENHIYLAKHPEVRAIVCLLLRSLFNAQPHNIPEYIKHFMKNPRLQETVSEFIAKEEKEKLMDEIGLDRKKHAFPKGSSPFSPFIIYDEKEESRHSVDHRMSTDETLKSRSDSEEYQSEGIMELSGEQKSLSQEESVTGIVTTFLTGIMENVDSYIFASAKSQYVSPTGSRNFVYK